MQCHSERRTDSFLLPLPAPRATPGSLSNGQSAHGWPERTDAVPWHSGSGACLPREVRQGEWFISPVMCSTPIDIRLTSPRFGPLTEPRRHVDQAVPICSLQAQGRLDQDKATERRHRQDAEGLGSTSVSEATCLDGALPTGLLFGVAFALRRHTVVPVETASVTAVP